MTSDIEALAAQFEAEVSAHFKEASIPTLMRWFQKNSEKSDRTYAHGEVQEMWVGWSLAAALVRERLARATAIIETIKPYIEHSRDRRLRKADKAKGQSTTDFHMEAVKLYEGWMREMSAFLAESPQTGKFTDGRGNDISHLVEKP